MCLSFSLVAYLSVCCVCVCVFRLLMDTLDKVKFLLRRRDRQKLKVTRGPSTYAGFNAAAASSSANNMEVDAATGGEQDHMYGVGEEEDGSHHAASSGTRLSPTDRLNIWVHDADHVLAIGSEVAALIDEHSIPPLWIQCEVKSYRAGAVR